MPQTPTERKKPLAVLFDSDETPILTVRRHTAAYFAAHGEKPRVFVMTFGCQQNVADSEKLSGMAEDLGYLATDDPADAALILVNTCAIREHAEKRALSIIGQYKHLKEKNPDLIIGVCGCMVAQEHRREELKKSFPYVDFVLCTSVLHRLPQLLAEVLEKGKRVMRGDEEYSVAEHVPIRRENGYRAYVSVMYGCNNFCSYCIVPYVRGRERSRAPAEVLTEVRELVEAGYKEITLLGQNVKSYGKDLEIPYDFADLLAEIDKIPGDYWLQFMTSHPKDATEKLVDVMAGSTHIAHRFHLPLQSGSDEILRRMNRHYDTTAYLKILDYMREKMPDIVVTSDIIVGFPGESEADFEATLNLLRRARFDMIFSFIYSPREGTPAAKMEGQISKETQNARFDRLLALQQGISLAANQPMTGKTVRVLCDGESKNDKTMRQGRTAGGKIVFFPEEIPAGAWAEIKIDRAEAFALWGTAAERK